MFITFEGPEGSGKTTQVSELIAFLRQKGRPVFATREPGGTPVGNQIRHVLFDLNNKKMYPMTETLLLLASRAQLVEEVIRPQLARGKVVVCDRYTDSTLAYQGYGHGVNLETLRTLNGIATGNLVPDLTLLLDVDVEEGLKRRADGGNWNRLDAYPLTFHLRVRHGYRDLAQNEPDHWVLINANRQPVVVQKAIRKVVVDKLEELGKQIY